MISTLGNNIKRLRIEKHIGVSELAKLAGVGIATISQIESGDRGTLRCDTLEKIASAIDVSVNDLLINSEDEIRVESDEITNFLDVLLVDFIKLDGEILNDREKQTLDRVFKFAFDGIRYDRLRNKEN